MKTDLKILRAELDDIDAEIHRLLIKRGNISRQVALSKKNRVRPAFRPARELDMTWRLFDRHKGPLPLASLEHIWREIITASTQVQAAFSVHLASAKDPEVRDLARFVFGYSVTLREHADTTGAVAALSEALGDLALISLAHRRSPRWWRHLDAAAPRGLRIVARLPFLAAPSHPITTPGLIVSHRLPKEEFMITTRQISYWALAGTRLPASLIRLGGEIAQYDEGDNSDMLVALPLPHDSEQIAQAFSRENLHNQDVRWVGDIGAIS